jgi:cytoskeletal protein RodZ
MPDVNETPVPPPQSETATEKVGDILRKERITRRIALETIAKDLKLNVKYVRALESNDYNDLPAAPYVRVYLRSLAKYLLLDPDDILKKFYTECGINDDKLGKDSDTKINVSMANEEKKSESKPWLIIFAIIVALALISLIANKINDPSSGHKKAVSDTTKTQSPAANPGEINEDSLLGSVIPHEAKAEDTSKPKEVKAEVKDTSSMTLEIKATKDSVWVQVFADGVSWKNWIKPGAMRKSTAKDSFNVHVGYSSMLQYTFNGKQLTIPNKDVAVFKLTRNLTQPEMWTVVKWNQVFKNKL